PVFVGSRRIAYRMAVPSGQARLTQDALLGLGIQVEGRLAGDGDRSGFGRMVILAMAALLADQHPTVLFDKLNRFAHRHRHIGRPLIPNLASGPMAVRMGSEITRTPPGSAAPRRACRAAP